jgi:hypothetical protein
MARKSKQPARKRIETHRHEEAKRRNIPTAEYQSVACGRRSTAWTCSTPTCLLMSDYWPI